MKAYRSEEGKNAVLAYYQILLKNLTVPYEDITIETSRGVTAILAAGKHSSPPLILLHGSSMNSAMWIKDINFLSQNFRVYAPDIPGEPGRSSEEQLSLEHMAYVDWLLDVLNHLNITKTAIAGISLGAWLAAKFAASHTSKVSKLVLLCPAGIGSQNHNFKTIASSLLAKGEEGMDELCRQINGGAEIPKIMLEYQKLIATVFHLRQETIPLFSDRQLKKLTMPSLLVVGGKDIMLNSMETAARYRQCVPSGSVKIMPDAGHSLTGLAKEISAFLLLGA